ncbi:hypothetical protein [Streptomyces sp. MJM1172]|uniref:hypothetical protein n=1 Tax=Streptomyces sp. MJM1172 TaxID=1703926 RepID=UPI00116134F3|nr:hypothetical protein [Streptomyces sp. MJM1172]
MSWVISRGWCPRGRQIIVSFTELRSEAGDPLFEVGDLLVEGVNVGGGSEPCGTPGVLTEGLGQPLLEPDDVLGLTGSTLSEVGEVGEEGPTADLRACGVLLRLRAASHDGGEEIAVPVDEAAVHVGRPCHGGHSDRQAVTGQVVQGGQDAPASAGRVVGARLPELIGW